MTYEEKREEEREKDRQLARKMVSVANMLQEKNIINGRTDEECSMLAVYTDRLFLRVDYDKSRIEISGNYPRFVDGNSYRPDTKADEKQLYRAKHKRRLTYVGRTRDIIPEEEK
ncbi:MAG: hypothetical protein AAB792_02865 [Patescibacteria group bacterium]